MYSLHIVFLSKIDDLSIQLFKLIFNFFVHFILI